MTRREEIARTAFRCSFHPDDAERTIVLFEEGHYPDLTRRCYRIADAILALPPVETSELAKRLREASKPLGHGEVGVLPTRSLYGDAATALDLKDAEIARLRALVDKRSQIHDMQVNLSDILTERAEKAEQERDEALKALGEPGRATPAPLADPLADVSSAPAVSGEWVMVPREPTREMIAAAEKAWMNRNLRDLASEPIPDSYRAMLASFPAAPDPVDEEREDAVWKMLTLAANTAERVCREHADPTAGASAAKAIRALRARKP